MIQIMLALRDVKAETFLRPFFVPTIAVAMRDIAQEIAREGDGNQLAMFTKDFELYQLASVDLESGDVNVPTQFPLKLCDCASLDPREKKATDFERDQLAIDDVPVGAVEAVQRLNGARR